MPTFASCVNGHDTIFILALHEFVCQLLRQQFHGEFFASRSLSTLVGIFACKLIDARWTTVGTLTLSISARSVASSKSVVTLAPPARQADPQTKSV